MCIYTYYYIIVYEYILHIAKTVAYKDGSCITIYCI